MNLATEWKYGTIAGNDDTVGTYAWVDAQNVLNGDTTTLRAYTNMFIAQTGNKFVARDAKLIIGSVIQGTSQAANEEFGAGTNEHTLGTSSNLWGSTFGPRDARRSDFGIALSMAELDSSNVLQDQTNYITVTGFKFMIPTDAVIAGVEVKIFAKKDHAGPGIDWGHLYYVQMRVHYTYTALLSGKGSSQGYIDINEVEEPTIPQNKFYQYLAYERNVFAGQWRDVENEPSLQINVNELPGELTVQLARNLDSKEVEYDEIELSGYDGEVLVTSQNNETILAGEETTYGIGLGTDLEVNHRVKVKEYYGGFEELLTSDGHVLLTSQNEALQVPNGYPRGRMYYDGYVSDFGLNYDLDNLNTEVKLLHQSDELNNETYRTPDTLKIDSYVLANLTSSHQFGGFFKYPGDTETVGFSFTADASYDLKRIVSPISGWRDNIITLALRTGGTVGSGTWLGAATAQILASGINILSFAFADPVALTNGSVYNVEYISAFQKQSASQSHPAHLWFGSNYAGGTSYANSGGGYVALTGDFAFQTWQHGGNTRVNELSIDPSQIMRKVLDYGRLQGGIIGYDTASIEDSFTVVSAPFNTNTLKEAADYVLTLTPSNWFYYIDPGELLFNLKSQPSVVSQWFTFKKDIIKLRLHKNIEKMVNNVLFTGGGDPALFREYVDAVSRAQWRKGLLKFSDNRVTNDDTADIMMASKANEVNQPIWLGQLEVLRAEHPKMVRPGELAGFRNSGTLIDLLTVQIVSVNVTPDRFVCQLGTQMPKTSQRIEDIKRNLKRLEIENNPSAPS